MGVFDTVEDNLVYAPKVGEAPRTFTLHNLRRNYEAIDKSCYKESEAKGGKSFGYRDEFDVGNGKTLICNTWKLYFAIKDSGANIGDTIYIGHPSRAVYTVDVKTSPEGQAKVAQVVADVSNDKDLAYLKDIERKHTISPEAQELANSVNGTVTNEEQWTE